MNDKIKSGSRVKIIHNGEIKPGEVIHRYADVAIVELLNGQRIKLSVAACMIDNDEKEAVDPEEPKLPEGAKRITQNEFYEVFDKCFPFEDIINSLFDDEDFTIITREEMVERLAKILNPHSGMRNIIAKGAVFCEVISELFADD